MEGWRLRLGGWRLRLGWRRLRLGGWKLEGWRVGGRAIGIFNENLLAGIEFCRYVTLMTFGSASSQTPLLFWIMNINSHMKLRTRVLRPTVIGAPCYNIIYYGRDFVQVLTALNSIVMSW